jgi:hypothetical protein
MHLAQKSGHTGLDVRQIVESYRDEIQTFRSKLRINFYQIRKFIAARIATRGPIVNQQRFRIVALQQSLQAGSIDCDHGGRWLGRPSFSLLSKSRNARKQKADRRQ